MATGDSIKTISIESLAANFLRLVFCAVFLWMVGLVWVASWSARPEASVPSSVIIEADRDPGVIDLRSRLRGAKSKRDIIDIQSRLILRYLELGSKEATEFLAASATMTARRELKDLKERNYSGLSDSGIPLLARIRLRDRMAEIHLSMPSSKVDSEIQEAIKQYDANILDLCATTVYGERLALAREKNNLGVAQFLWGQTFKDDEVLKRKHYQESLDAFKEAQEIIADLEGVVEVSPEQYLRLSDDFETARSDKTARIPESIKSAFANGLIGTQINLATLNAHIKYKKKQILKLDPSGLTLTLENLAGARLDSISIERASTVDGLQKILAANRKAFDEEIWFTPKSAWPEGFSSQGR